MSKVKVAILLISPGKAGVESVILNLLKGFDSEKVELFLLSSAEIASYYSRLVDKDHHLVLGRFFTKPKNKYAARLYPFFNNRLQLEERKLKRWSKRVEKFMDKHSIKIVHSHLVWDYWIASDIRKRRSDISYINTMHGTLALDPQDNYFPFFNRKTVLGFLSNVDVFTSACQYFFDLLHLWKVPVKRLELISNGIDKIQTSGFIQGRDHLKICFMGGGRPHQKGGDLLMHALNILVTEFKLTHIQLVVYGFVPEHSKEKELAQAMQLQSYIEWKGFVEPPNHLEGMKQSDIFVLPSRHEGVANTLMEAIGMGMPIVATKVGGTPELIKDGKNGLLCFADARDIAECLQMLILDESLRRTFHQANLKLSESYYWDGICGQYESLYRSMESK